MLILILADAPDLASKAAAAVREAFPASRVEHAPAGARPGELAFSPEAVVVAPGDSGAVLAQVAAWRRGLPHETPIVVLAGDDDRAAISAALAAGADEHIPWSVGAAGLRHEVAEAAARRATAPRGERLAVSAVRVLAATSSNTGDAFFRALVRSLAEAAGMRWALVGEQLADDPGRARGLAFWNDGAHSPPGVDSLAGTAAAEASDELECECQAGARERFPRDELIQRLRADSFAGLGLRDGQGLRLGFLALFHDAPIPDLHTRVMPLLRMVSARATAELSRLRAEHALRISERRYRVLHDANPLMIFTLDSTARVLDVNRAGAATLGLEPGDLTGEPILMFVQPQDRDRLLARLAKAFAEPGEVLHWTFTARHRSGRDVPVECSATVMPDSSGTGPELLLVGADVSARVQAERSLRERGEQLRQAQKMEAVGRLAAGVAHDFNNLLTAIRGYVSLAQRTLRDGHPALESLAHVEEAARQATGVSSSLLTFARKTHAHKEPLELAKVVESAARLLRRVLPPGTTLTVDTARARGRWVRADETQIHQVLMNLGTNARDAVAAGGSIAIVLEPVPGPDGDESLRLVCTDSGVGMAPDVAAHAFEPFFTTKPVGGGVGLGLSIVHGIVTEHGGTVELQSAPGKGTSVTVVLPTCPSPAPASDAHPADLGDASLLGGIALVVEPNQLVRGLLGSMLEALGYEVLLAPSAPEAVALLPRPPRLVTALIANIPPVAGEGASLLESVRAVGHDPDMLVVTGTPDGEPSPDPRIGRLFKPFQLANLRAALIDVARKRPARTTP